MSKEMRELLNSIDNKKIEAKKLLNAGDLEGAKALKNEIVAMREKYELLAELEQEQAPGEPFNHEDNEGKGEQINASDAFIKGIVASAKGMRPDDKTLSVLNATTMTEGVPEDGGLTVPQDIRTKVKELRRAGVALENYVNREKVQTLSGSRNIEVNADHTPFDNVEEAAEFPEIEGPQFKKIKYDVKKKGGILKATYELFQDTAENLRGYIVRWIAKKARATRNLLIIKKLDEICETPIAITDLDGLKDIFNVELDPAIALTSIVITNQDGYNYLDKLKDSNGNYILQKDPTAKTKKLLFGEYPIIPLSNKTLKTVENKAPIYCGDLKEAITIFDRETMVVEFNEKGAGWGSDLIEMKVRERLDVQAVDTDAVVKGQITIPARTVEKQGKGKSE